jgi:cytochrome c biogenesis protein ResB
MTVFYVLGTIFPQGRSVEEYEKAGGRFIPLVRALDLTEVFVSPLFLALSALLSVNLAVCIYDRWRAMRKRPAFIPEDVFFHNPGVFALGEAERLHEFAGRIRAMGYRERFVSEGIYVFEKGLPYWWLSWIYHLGIVVAIAGFLSTAFFAFEKEVTLFPGRPETISLYSPDTRFNKLIKKFNRHLKKLGFEIPQQNKGKDFTLNLKGFDTEYYQTLKVDYPKGALNRLAMGLGFRPAGAAKPEEGYAPKMWTTSLFINTPEGKRLSGRLRVNRPYRVRGLTLYQMGFEQKLDLLVNGRKVEAKSMEPFEIKGVKGKMFTAGMVRTGKLYRKDGSTVEMTPFFELKKTEDGKKTTLGELHLGKPAVLDATAFVFRGMEEGSALSYRHDPGVTFISISVWLVFIGLTLRSLGYWGRLQMTERDGRLYALLSTRGLLANKARITERLKG